MMSLLDIKNHMMKVKMASLSSICQLFKIEPDLLRHMLEHWVRKGKIRKCMKKPACGTKCMQCSPLVTELYEWCS